MFYGQVSFRWKVQFKMLDYDSAQGPSHSQTLRACDSVLEKLRTVMTVCFRFHSLLPIK